MYCRNAPSRTGERRLPPQSIAQSRIEHRRDRFAAQIFVQIVQEPVGAADKHLVLRPARQVHGDVRVGERTRADDRQAAVRAWSHQRKATPDRLVFKRFDQRGLIDDTAARDVDDHRVALHRRQFLGPDHAFGLRRGGHGEG